MWRSHNTVGSVWCVLQRGPTRKERACVRARGGYPMNCRLPRWFEKTTKLPGSFSLLFVK